MRLEPPVPVTREEYTLDVRDIEPLLHSYPMDKKTWRAGTIMFQTGN